MKLNSILLLVMIVSLTSCFTPYQTNVVKQSPRQKVERKVLPETVYLIDSDNDGSFEAIEIAKENHPEPIQGKDRWLRDFYGAIKYPASARENGIGGIVTLDIEIDQQGKVVNVGIKKSLSMECDNEAIKAYKNASKQGYHPMMINNFPTRFKMEYSVGFWLE